MIRHYVNENEDVLISDLPYEKIKENWYEIPSFMYTDILALIYQVGLYNYCKACKKANYNNSDTDYDAITSYLKTQGFDVDIWSNLVDKEKYKMYDYLSLNCLCGGNSIKFKFLKPFIIRKDFLESITKEYDYNKIQEFQNKLIENGHTKYG